MLKRVLLIAIFPFLVFIFSGNHCFAQPGKKHTQLIQLSGIVLEKDSLQAIPFVAILIRNSTGGTIADNTGFFSFIVEPGDTVLFSALGYKSNSYSIPDSLSTDKYSLIHIMSRDTANLKPFVFYSWPSKEAFRAAFLNLNIPSNDLDRARHNMALAAQKARYGEARSPEVNYLQTQQQEYDRLYWAGQLPPNNLLNPLAWAKFIQAWKDGTLNLQ